MRSFLCTGDTGPIHVCPDPFSLFALEGAGHETSLACVSSADSALSRSRLCCSLACLSSGDSALSRSRLCCSLASLCKLYSYYGASALCTKEMLHIYVKLEHAYTRNVNVRWTDRQTDRHDHRSTGILRTSN